MSPQDEQWRRTSLLCLYTAYCSQYINKQNGKIADETLKITAISLGITILNQRIIKKDNIEFVTELPCFLGHYYIIP